MKPSAFRYATLEGVKARVSSTALASSGLDDPAILLLIENACAKINRWTRQVFQPYPDVVMVKGRGDPLLTHPDALPFVGLNAISLITNRTTGEFKEMDRIIPDMRNFPEANRWFNGANHPSRCRLLYENGGVRAAGEVQWDQGDRLIHLVSLIAGFTKGHNNIQMDGWWGWLESYKSVSVPLKTAIAANTTVTTVSVTTLEDAVTGDFIEVGDTIAVTVQTDTNVPKRAELAIVKTIAGDGSGGFNLTVDTTHPYPFAIAVDSPVYCFGRVPVALAGVAEYMAVRDLQRRIAEITGTADDLLLNEAIDGNLKSERTDNYSYTLGGSRSSAGAGGGSLGKYTGSVEQDLVLRQFVAPTVTMRLV